MPLTRQQIREARLSRRAQREQEAARARFPVEVAAASSPILNGVHSTRSLTVTVRHSSRVHQRSLVGDALTVLLTPRVPFPSYDSFLNRIWTPFRTIFRQAVDHFGRFVYTLQYDITVQIPTTHGHSEFSTDLIVYPCQGGHVVSDYGDLDFTDKEHQAELFAQTFQHWSLKNNSGLTLISVNSVEIQLVKSQIHVAAASFFDVPDIGYSCVNVINEDEACFKWSILALEVNQRKSFNGLMEMEELLKDYSIYDFTGIEFPADYRLASAQFEALNRGTAVHIWKRVFGWGSWDSFPVRVSPRLQEAGVQHFDLHYAEDYESDKKHFVGIVHLASFCHYRKGGAYKICRVCLETFDTNEQLQDHYLHCNTRKSFTQQEVYPREPFYTAMRVPGSVKEYCLLFSTSSIVEKELKIDTISLKFYPTGTTISWTKSINPVHQFMDYMKGKKTKVVVQTTKQLHQLITGLDGYDVVFSGDIFGAVDDTNMTCLEIGPLRFADTSRYFESKAKCVNSFYEEWERFRKFGIDNYDLDPLQYYTLPSFAWSSALLHCNAKPAMINDKATYSFIERAKRGALNIVASRYFKPNNEYLPEYDPLMEKTYLAYFDIKSAYGYSMKQYLPYSDYEFIDVSEVHVYPYTLSHTIRYIADDSPVGYFFEVDLRPPPNIHWQNRHSDLPLAPEWSSKNTAKKMLIASLEPKLNYVVHFRLLKFYLKRGMILDKVHKVLRFTQRPWLKPYIEKQELLRDSATSPEMEQAIKLMTNSVFGKSCENPRSNCKSKLFRLDTVEGRSAFNNKGINERTTMVRKLSHNIISTTELKTAIRMDQQVATGVTILELGKLQLYEWYYEKLQNALLTPPVRMLYCDTDSLILATKMDPRFITASFPQFFDGKTGSLKDETKGVPASLFVAAKPKHYCFETLTDRKIRLSGLPKQQSRVLDSDVFMQVLEDGADPVANVTTTHTKDHVITVEEHVRHYLNAVDKTRHYIDTFTSLPFGHISLLQ